MKTKRLLPSLVLLGSVLVTMVGFASAAPQARPISLDQALKGLSSFQAGIDSAAYWKFREAVLALRSDPAARAAGEKKLLAFLQTKAPLPAKMVVCRELRVIGGAASVPALGKFLLDKVMSDAARYALEDIADPSADRALIQALGKTVEPLRIGIITALGFRKSLGAVAPLAKLLAGKDADPAVAAAYSLGRIGGDEASAALLRAMKSPLPAVKDAAVTAALACAEGFLAAKNPQPAAALYDYILLQNPTAPTRRAAALGKIRAAGGRAAEVLLDSLRSNDEIVQEAAVAGIKDAIPAEGIGPVTAILPLLAEGSRVKLLAVLAEYPKERVLPSILNSLKSTSKFERIAALKALASAGDASSIPTLAEAAATLAGEEQAAARASLSLIKGREADEAVLTLLGKNISEAIKIELIQAVGERRIFAGKSVLMDRLSEISFRLRTQALKGLKIIGTPSDIPGLLDYLPKAPDDAEREETENAAAALAMKIAQPIGRANTVKARLNAEKDAGRKAGLIRVLGKIGDDSSLPDLRRALSSADTGVKDAAIRAIAGWPTAAPIEDVFEIAKSSGDETHKLLALRGFIRMTALGKYRIPENVVSDLRLAAEISRRPDEKRLVLAALADFACPDGLKLAQSMLGDPDLKAEAQAAVTAIQKRLK
jgi:HEAT repeat protein